MTNFVLREGTRERSPQRHRVSEGDGEVFSKAIPLRSSVSLCLCGERFSRAMNRDVGGGTIDSSLPPILPPSLRIGRKKITRPLRDTAAKPPVAPRAQAPRQFL